MAAHQLCLYNAVHGSEKAKRLEYLLSQRDDKSLISEILAPYDATIMLLLRA
jgi:hypothetical protein